MRPYTTVDMMDKLGNFRFYSLVKYFRKNGLTLRTHRNSKRLPSSSLSAETVEQVIKFINNAAEEQALLLPGHVPGFKRIDVKLLPSDLTKKGLWRRCSDIPSPMDCQDKAPQILQTRYPLSTVDQNIWAAQHAYDNYSPTDKEWQKTEGLVSLGSSLITTAMACVDVLFTDEELVSSNTSGTGGYRQLDELKMRFFAWTLR